MNRDPNLAFELRLQCLKKEYQPHPIIVRAFDDQGWDSAGRVKLAIEVRQGGKVIFPRGFLHCALHGSSDGIEARELVLATVEMKSGDTDQDYFASYSPDQLSWAEEWGERISMEREVRYCDENGNPKRER